MSVERTFSFPVLQPQHHNAKANSQSRCFMIELSQPQMRSFKLSCFHWIKSFPSPCPKLETPVGIEWMMTTFGDLQLTTVISRRKMKVQWRKVSVQSDHDLLAELWHFPLAGLVAGQEENLPPSRVVNTPSSWRCKVGLFLIPVLVEVSLIFMPVFFNVQNHCISCSLFLN